MAIEATLRPYQVQVGRAIMESVLRRRGLTFSVAIARQGGKNELSAQLEVLLLTLFMSQGGNLIKAAPTFKPQAVISMNRLQERLNQAGFTRFWKREHGNTIRLGRARALFLSAEPASNVVGNTAHLLLEVDEAQDVDREKFNKEFRPMGATTNATSVLYGTAWSQDTLLEEMKAANLEWEQKDGLRRHFEFPWQEVAKYNPDYQRYVEGEQQRLGENHPLFLTQYCLKPVAGGGGWLSASQRTQLQGSHPRQRQPGPPGPEGWVYVAGVDLAGAAEGETPDAVVRAAQPGRDSTVVTIGGLDFQHQVLEQPRIYILDHYWWTGRPQPELYAGLVDILKERWGCRRVVVDATGVGAGVAGFLSHALGRGVVLPFVFTAPSKSELGFELLAAINSGRLKMYAPDGSAEFQELWKEIEQAQCSFRPNRTMNFFVEPAQGHDDFLMSLCLLVAAAQYRPRSARGRGVE